MTEPGVASSDATNIETEIDARATNTSSMAANGGRPVRGDPHCELLIVMGKTDPAAHRFRQQSMILVPARRRACTIVRHRCSAIRIAGTVTRKSCTTTSACRSPTC